MADRVVNKVKRVAGAVGRAAREAMGRPEAGDDLLFQVLHADHEEVAQLFDKVLASPDPDRLIGLWGQLSISLTAHSRAEAEVVYERLRREAQTSDQIPHSLEEHDCIEKLLADADAMIAGTDEFFATVTDLERLVRNHVDEEEGSLLPKAAAILSEDERDNLVRQFRARKRELQPEVEQELEPVLDRERKALQSGDLDEDDEEEDQRNVQRLPAAKAAPKVGARQTSSGRTRRDVTGSGDLDRRTVKQLQEIARDKGVEGRSKMTKPELVRALKRL
jgi:hypothetical protein